MQEQKEEGKCNSSVAGEGVGREADFSTALLTKA
jgi:hypothetical protein